MKSKRSRLAFSDNGPSVTILVGGQYGSEGKGCIAGYLAPEHDVIVRVGAPNAGHTLKMGDSKWKMRQLPVAGLVNPDCVMLIGAAGLINLEVLKTEMGYIKGIEGRLFIDRNAGILEPHHIKEEEEGKMNASIGSTCEGVGAALKHKISRGKDFRTAKDVPELAPYIINVSEYINKLPQDKSVFIEGTQGYSLSLNHGPYPFCTGRDVIASSMLSDIGLSPFFCDDIIMVVRTYPIRVAGNSGPMLDEIDWPTVTKEAGYPSELQEKTTVTKRIRRVGRFDMDQVIEAVKVNRPTQLALTFIDYISYEDKGKTEYDDLTVKSKAFINMIEDKTGVPVNLIKTGIEYDDIVDRR